MIKKIYLVGQWVFHHYDDPYPNVSEFPSRVEVELAKAEEAFEELAAQDISFEKRASLERGAYLVEVDLASQKQTLLRGSRWRD